MLLSGCSWSEALGLGWPEGITPEAHLNRELWIGSLIASLVVGVIVWGLIFWSLGVSPAQEGRHRAAAPVRLQHAAGAGAHRRAVPDHSVLFYFTVVVQEKMLHKDPNPEVVIDVTALPVELEVRLPEDQLRRRHLHLRRRRQRAQSRDGSSPRASSKHGEEIVSARCAGLNPEDRQYLNFDKVETLGSSTEIPVLVLPPGKRIEFQIASADVIHAFWVPEFLFKRDVMPPIRRPTTPTTSSRSARSTRPARSSADARRCAAPTTR